MIRTLVDGDATRAILALRREATGAREAGRIAIAESLERAIGVLEDVRRLQMGRRPYTAAELPPACTQYCPPEFVGRWQDWHRGTGCSLDDGKPRTPEGAAEMEALGKRHPPVPARRCSLPCDGTCGTLEHAPIPSEGER